MSYQDLLDAQGNVVGTGVRDCATRWAGISEFLAEHGMAGFSALDIGAHSGYFSQRMAQQFAATVIAVDDDRELLDMQCPEVRKINRRLSAREIDHLGPFDVMIAMSVLHHMGDWREVLDVMIRNTRRVMFIETQAVTEVLLPKLPGDVPELVYAVEELGGTPVARTPRSEGQYRVVWAIET